MDRTTVRYWRFLNSAGINPNTVWEEVEDEGGRYLRTSRGKDEWATFVPDSMHLDRPQHKANWATACNVEGNALVLNKPSDPKIGSPVPPCPKGTSAWDTQVGGDHYRKMKIQPFQFSMANKLDPMQHTIIKYVSRFRAKNGIEDLEKAKQTIDLLIQWEKDNAATAN